MHSSILMGALECSSTSSVVPHCLRLEGALVCGAVELQPNRRVSGRGLSQFPSCFWVAKILRNEDPVAWPHRDKMPLGLLSLSKGRLPETGGGWVLLPVGAALSDGGRLWARGFSFSR